MKWKYLLLTRKRYDIGDTNRHTVSKPRYAFLGKSAVFATRMISCALKAVSISVLGSRAEVLNGGYKDRPEYEVRRV